MDANIESHALDNEDGNYVDFDGNEASERELSRTNFYPDTLDDTNPGAQPGAAKLQHQSELAQLAFTPPFSLGSAVSPRSLIPLEPQFPIPEDEMYSLILSYCAETATWCDTTDHLKHFSVLSAHNMLDIKVFKAAALALAARQMSVLGRIEEDIALKCYQYTIRLLIQQHPDQIDQHILATCILLCVYEMMASDIPEWRRHLKVCFVDRMCERGRALTMTGMRRFILVQALEWIVKRFDQDFFLGICADRYA